MGIAPQTELNSWRRSRLVRFALGHRRPYSWSERRHGSLLGNFPEYCSLEAIRAPGVSGVPKGDWTEILSKSKLQGGTQNLFPITFDGTVTHIRLRIYPDGGVARLRVHGEVRPDWKQLKKNVDLAAAANGGEVVTCNDMFFGQKDNLILPSRARTMGDAPAKRTGPRLDYRETRYCGHGPKNRSRHESL
jgi:allantoicase